ncbi:aldose 1-epimerase family protein [Anaeromicropila populeti]|uniref:Galactose mutarotase n=1 Tax=Anaeromicropila populeti TaxID=37658 RepID=A0A1I6HLE3_9FIRM|nr:aldose 1-epimerase family protein [Anaeromicropila populeti]SFR55293.1 Galactose mutarotase [Anaeromicropila populeti]
MAVHHIENDYLEIKVNDFGAELVSIIHRQSQTQYLWNGEETYWKRQSPILFPIVGSLRNKEYTYKGKTYSLPQHGFARDREFKLVEKSEHKIVHRLIADQETLQVFPFPFELEVSYELIEHEIVVEWKVKNTGEEVMHFSIGAHPAFMCPLDTAHEKQADYYFRFDSIKPLVFHKLSGQGLCLDTGEILETRNGIFPIKEGLFDEDALIFQNNQVHKVELLKPNHSVYLSVEFDAPLFGLWSPAGKQAPFVCIEPWYGRCDSVGFQGDLAEREWSNQINAKETFHKTYSIKIFQES